MEESRMSGRKWNWPPKFRKWGTRERANFKIGMLFLLPWTIGFLVFTLYPMVASFAYSFSIYHSKAPLEWVGLKNYADLLKDDLFWQSLFNTLYMVAIGVPLGALLIRRIPSETFRRVCMSFDAWVVSFGISTLLRDLHVFESNAAYSVMAAVIIIDAWLLYRFFSIGASPGLQPS